MIMCVSIMLYYEAWRFDDEDFMSHSNKVNSIYTFILYNSKTLLGPWYLTCYYFDIACCQVRRPELHPRIYMVDGDSSLAASLPMFSSTKTQVQSPEN